MAKDGGGYTFIPYEAVQKGKFRTLINQIFKDRSRVLLRFQKKDGLQPYALKTQLPIYNGQKLDVLMHSYSGYTKPLNYEQGDYMYLGILPALQVKATTEQGFRYHSSVSFANFF